MIGCKIQKKLKKLNQKERYSNELIYSKFIRLSLEDVSIHCNGLQGVDPSFVLGQPFENLITQFLVGVKLVSSGLAVLKTLINVSRQILFAFPMLKWKTVSLGTHYIMTNFIMICLLFIFSRMGVASAMSFLMTKVLPLWSNCRSLLDVDLFGEKYPQSLQSLILNPWVDRLLPDQKNRGFPKLVASSLQTGWPSWWKHPMTWQSLPTNILSCKPYLEVSRTWKGNFSTLTNSTENQCLPRVHVFHLSFNLAGYTSVIRICDESSCSFIRLH